MSCQPCGCDEEAAYVCRFHSGEQAQFVPVLGTEPTAYAWVGPVIKDSGKREEFTSGMVRDTTEGKTDYLLTRDGPMYQRWAIHLTNGAKKYDKRNWMKGAGSPELERAKESAARHFEQWLSGETDEDHAAATFFNINQVEYLKAKGIK